MSAVLKQSSTADELESIYRWRPQLRHAIQPPPLPKVDGTFRFDPSADWAAFVAALPDFRFRESHPRNWCGPFAGYGDCLAGFSEPGDLQWYDPMIEPQDGDLVLVAWGPQARASRQFQQARADWLEKYGREPGALATKRLRKFGGRWVLCVKNSMYWLDDCKILGVLVRKERGVQVLHAPITSAIGPNAASDPAVVSSPADGNIVYSSGTQPRIELAGLNASVSYTADAATAAGAGVKALVTWTAQATINNLTSGVAVGEARLGFQVTINGSLVDDRWISLETHTTDYALFSGGSSYSVPSGQNITVSLAVARAFTTSGASPAQTITWRAASLSLQSFKR